MSRFCAKCGLEYSRDKPFINNLCLKCYLEENPLLILPDKIVVELCKNCGSVKLGSKWVETSGFKGLLDAINRIVQSRIRVRFEDTIVSLNLSQLKFGVQEVEVYGEVEIGKEKVVQRGILKLEVKPILCPKCSKKISGSFDAIVQIRSSRGKLTLREVREVKKALGSIGKRHLSNIVSIEEVSGGLDIKVLTHNTAREISNVLRERYGAKTLESHKQVGVDDRGKKKTRLTISVRIPSYKTGDLVLASGKPVLIEGFKRGRVFFKELESGKVESLNIEEAWGGLIKPLPEDSKVLEVIYAYRDDKNAYLIEPEKPDPPYTIPLMLLPNSLKVGDTLRLLIVNGKPYVLE